MSKRHFKLMLDGERYCLRLTAAGQRELKERFHEEVLQTVFEAASDSEKMSALLEAALNWKGNENPIRDGGELYDRLVDEGWSGQVRFGGLAFDIAAASGLLDEKHAEKLKKSVEEAVNGVFDQLEEAADDEGEEKTRPAVEQG